MPVVMSLTNARKFYWTCTCGKSMGQWTKREGAEKDFQRHLNEDCSERTAE